jgi:hypothetical protein
MNGKIIYFVFQKPPREVWVIRDWKKKLLGFRACRILQDLQRNVNREFERLKQSRELQLE